MFDIIILALALSMDAFAVSIGLGAKHIKKRRSLAIMSGLYFGLFQGLMPLIGYLAGKGLISWIQDYSKWIAFILLVLIGGKMIYEAFSESLEEDIAKISHKTMLILAIATSIDAMAAGFSLNLSPIKPFLSCSIIGLCTLSLSSAGVFIGAKTGVWLEDKAEILGGVTLILIAFKTLLY